MNMDLTLDISTTSQVESINAIIAAVCNSGTSLISLFSILKKVFERNSIENAFKAYKSAQVVLNSTSFERVYRIHGQVVYDISKCVSSYTLSLMITQMELGCTYFTASSSENWILGNELQGSPFSFNTSHNKDIDLAYHYFGEGDIEAPPFSLLKGCKFWDVSYRFLGNQTRSLATFDGSSYFCGCSLGVRIGFHCRHFWSVFLCRGSPAFSYQMIHPRWFIGSNRYSKAIFNHQYNRDGRIPAKFDPAAASTWNKRAIRPAMRSFTTLPSEKSVGSRFTRQFCRKFPSWQSSSQRTPRMTQRFLTR